jgi:hypothetical protein
MITAWRFQKIQKIPKNTSSFFMHGHCGTEDVPNVGFLVKKKYEGVNKWQMDFVCGVNR